MDKYEYCKKNHISKLENYLSANKIQIWSEHGDKGWVNLSCDQCDVTHELVLNKLYEEDTP